MRFDSSIENLKTVFEIEPETGKVFWKIDRLVKKAGDEAGGINKSTNTFIITFDRAQYRRDDLIWAFHFGSWPTEKLARINGSRHDYLFKNLILKSDKIYLQKKKINFMPNSWEFSVHDVVSRHSTDKLFDIFPTFYEAKEYYLKFNNPL